MTTSPRLPDIDPSIALAQEARQTITRGLRANRPAVQDIMESAKRERAQFITALLRRSVARLRALFVPAQGAPALNRSEPVLAKVVQRRR